MLRALVVALSAVTVVANGSTSPTGAGRLLHAVPPAMFAICFETVAAAARHDATASPRHPAAARWAMWVLAPRRTFLRWRRQVLDLATGDVVALPRGGDGATATLAPGRRGGAIGKPTSEWPTPLAGPTAGSDAAAAPPGSSMPLSRLATAREVLTADAGATAATLPARLAAAGHPVSVRTTQRIRRQVLQPAPPPTDALAEDR